MSAILSVDDLNDFITPGVACIKPVETLPAQQPTTEANEYEVTTEDKVATANAPPASISLTDCLACSGCVTSAEAVLVSLQSHAEVLSTLDAYPELLPPGEKLEHCDLSRDGKIFVASVSPQSRASIAATYRVSEREAGNMIQQLLSGPRGLRAGGAHNSGFTWVIDTNAMRQVALVAAANEVCDAVEDDRNDQNPSGIRFTEQRDRPKRPILTSACPGWICYAEKTHPHILPHISRVKSPQALTGTLVKSVLASKLGVPPHKIWHVAVMPCFDKKLEASRAELTDLHWRDTDQRDGHSEGGVRDVDCVITARELLMLADSRSISFPSLPRTALSKTARTPFPDPHVDEFLFASSHSRKPLRKSSQDQGTRVAQEGTSGAYLWHVMKTLQASHPASKIDVQRGRNADVAEYTLQGNEDTATVRAARYYGFRNIQNLVRKLKPKRESRMPGVATRPSSRRTTSAVASAGSAATDTMSQYAYIEVMACPGGCTNGGGQIKVGDVGALRGTSESGIENGSLDQTVSPSQKAWLGLVDEAYFSADNSSSDDSEQVSDTDRDDNKEQDADKDSGRYQDHDTRTDSDDLMIDGISRQRVKAMTSHWADCTGIAIDKLLYTSYRRVESDVGKKQVGDAERVAGLASTIGGGW